MENIWMLLQQTVAGGLCALFLLLLQRIFRNLLSPGGSTESGGAGPETADPRGGRGAGPPF